MTGWLGSEASFPGRQASDTKRSVRIALRSAVCRRRSNKGEARRYIYLLHTAYSRRIRVGLCNHGSGQEEQEEEQLRQRQQS